MNSDEQRVGGDPVEHDPAESVPDDVEADNCDESTGSARPTEIGGRDGPDPTRYGDWEKAGRCIDF